MWGAAIGAVSSKECCTFDILSFQFHGWLVMNTESHSSHSQNPAPSRILAAAATGREKLHFWISLHLFARKDVLKLASVDTQQFLVLANTPRATPRLALRSDHVPIHLLHFEPNISSGIHVKGVQKKGTAILAITRPWSSKGLGMAPEIH